MDHTCAPGPFWPALQVSGGQTTQNVEKFGQQVPMGAPASLRKSPMCMWISRPLRRVM